MMHRVIVRALIIAVIAPTALCAQNAVEQAGAGQVFETLPNGGVIEI